MAMATEDTTTPISHWPPGARLYHTDDDRHFVVIVDEFDTPDGSRSSVRRQPTTILYTTEDGGVTDMDIDFTFDPGTDHAAAVAAAGFTLVSA